MITIKKSANSLRLTAFVFSLTTALPALSQVVPDAGRTLQELAPPLAPPKATPELRIEAPSGAPTAPGGQRAEVQVQKVHFSGNSVFSEAQLLAQLGNVAGKTFDLAGLRGLAEQISQFYRAAGYPFARAYLPPQALSEGLLRIEISEGRFGRVQATGDAELATGAQGFLAALQPGSVILDTELERATLILDDQPGIKVAPLIRPGQELGTGDLDVRVSRDRRMSGELGLDNYGNRYNGEYRARLNLQADSPFLFGDQLVLRSLLTNEKMWLGSLAYSLPLGASGLRGQVSYAHTSYELGKQFAALEATGTAKVTSVGVTYPMLRSQKANATLGATYHHKVLQDKQGAAGTQTEKSSDSLPATLQFDLRDGLGGGGISYGSVSWTSGKLDLGAALLASDQASLRTDGRFNKFNLDVARMQALSGNFSLFGRFSGQYANNNLDSSEGFGIGGPSGVRAYPVGEGYGDEGWLGQLELRYAFERFAPYAFYDAGKVKINAEPVDNSENDRTLAGAGLGVRFQAGRWSTDTVIAWRIEGGEAQSDTVQRNSRVWMTASYLF